MDRGYFGIGIYNGKYKVNLGTLIRSANLFGANFVYTVGNRYEGQASAVGHDNHIPIFNFESVSDLRTQLPGAQIVIVEDNGEDLREFRHPENAVYLLGAEDHGVPDDIVAAYRAKIDTEYSLNVSTAGSIVMYDRTID